MLGCRAPSLCLGDWLPEAQPGLFGATCLACAECWSPEERLRRGVSASLGVTDLLSATMSSILEPNWVIISTNLPPGFSQLTPPERHPQGGTTNFQQQGVAKGRAVAPVKVSSPAHGEGSPAGHHTALWPPVIHGAQGQGSGSHS